MKINKHLFLITIIALLYSCKDSNTEDDFTSQTEIEDNTLPEKTNFKVKPEDCISFFNEIDFTNTCLANNVLELKEVATTSKACQIDIQSSLFNNGELDVLFFYETDENNMESFHVTTNANKMENVPGATHRNIENLADVAFIVHRENRNTKILVMSIENVRISLQSQKADGKNHCMYDDDQLELMARAILEKIN